MKPNQPARGGALKYRAPLSSLLKTSAKHLQKTNVRVYNLSMGFELTAEQKQAENMIAHWFYHSERQTFVLTGYAGTGKTALLKNVVCQRLELVPDVSAAFVTPTGKAATVLIKKGIPACTVHRLIYQSIAEEQEIEHKGKKVKI